MPRPRMDVRSPDCDTFLRRVARHQVEDFEWWREDHRRQPGASKAVTPTAMLKSKETNEHSCEALGLQASQHLEVTGFLALVEHVVYLG